MPNTEIERIVLAEPEDFQNHSITVTTTRGELVEAANHLSEARLLMARVGAECVQVMNQIDALINQIDEESRS